jgi:hypothetical protein
MRTILSLFCFVILQFNLSGQISGFDAKLNEDSTTLLKTERFNTTEAPVMLSMSSCDDLPPLITDATPTTCSPQFCDGSLTFVPNGGNPGGPWDVLVYDHNNLVFSATNVTGSITVTNLCSGNHIIETINLTDDCRVSGTGFVPPTIPPMLQPVNNVIACNYYVLPEINGFSLTGNQAYYTSPGGTGTVYHPGDVIIDTTTLYIYDGNFFCNDEESFLIVVIPGPIIDSIEIPIGCGSYTLPEITGTNITENAAYYEGSWATGTQYQPGDEIPINYQLYAYDEYNGCYDEELVDIEIRPVPLAIPDQLGGTCSGDPVILTATAIPNGQLTTTYFWTGPNGYFSIDQSPTDIVEPGIYTLIVTSDGCSSEPADIEVIINGNPDITITGPGAVCTGDIAVLTASGGVDYQWDTGENTPSITVQIDNTSTFSVTATDANGCTGTATITINALDLPGVGIETNVPDCLETAFELTANGATNYSWSTGENSQSISIFPTGPTTYSVTGTDINGCSNSASILVDLPLAPDAPEVSCSPTSNTLTYSWPPVPNIAYAVTVLTGQVGTLTNNTFVISGLIPGEIAAIEVVASNAAGCTASTQIDCQALDCDNPPTLAIDPVAALCEDANTVDLNVVIGNSDGTGSGSWTGTGIIDATAGIFDPAAAGIGAHVISYTFVEGLCTVSDVITVEVNGLLEAPQISCNADFNFITFDWQPVQNAEGYSVQVNGGMLLNLGTNTSFTVNNLAPGELVDIVVFALSSQACGDSFAQLTCSTLDCADLLDIDISEDQIFCAQEDIQLEAFADGAVSYSWSPSIFLSCTDCPNPVASPAATTTFTVTVEDEFGCVNSASVTLYKEEFPNFFFPNEVYACYGEDFEFCAPDAMAYEWTGPGNYASNGQCLTLNNMNEAQVGVYTLNISANPGCVIEKHILVIYEIPVEILSPADTICKGEHIRLRSSIENAVAYEWGPETLVDCHNCPEIEVRPLQTTTFSLTVETEEGCFYTDHFEVAIDDDCIGEPGDNNPESLSGETPTSRRPVSRIQAIPVDIYPNPASDVLHIRMDTEIPVSFQLYDLRGRAVMPKISSEGLITKLAVDQLSAGIYLLKIKTNNTIQTNKVIITK